MNKGGININIDMKVIFIIILAGLVIFQFMFNDGKVIEKYEKEINELKIKNDELSSSNKKLKAANEELIREIDVLYRSIDSTIAEIKDKEREIDSLNDEKDKVTGFVNKLNATGVTSEMSKYLNRRHK